MTTPKEMLQELLAITGNSSTPYKDVNNFMARQDITKLEIPTLVMMMRTTASYREELPCFDELLILVKEEITNRGTDPEPLFIGLDHDTDLDRGWSWSIKTRVKIHIGL